jgi:hypothetical protein
MQERRNDAKGSVMTSLRHEGVEEDACGTPADGVDPFMDALVAERLKSILGHDVGFAHWA